VRREVHDEPRAEPDSSIMTYVRRHCWPSFGPRGREAFGQTSRRVMLLVSSHSLTLAQERGSLCSQALTLWAGTTSIDHLLLSTAWTIRARSVREERSSVTSSAVVKVSPLATMPPSLDVRRLPAS